MELQKIAEAVKTSIPKIAKAMEHIFANLIISRYKQKQAQKAVGECDKWLNWIKPEYQKYNDIKNENKSKKCFLRDLRAEQKATSKLNISKQVSLSKEIATLIEDMEELKSELSNLLLYYKDEVEFKELCSKIPEYEVKRKKQEDLQNILGTRISDQTKEYLSLKDKVTSDEEVEFKLQRDILRPVTISEAKKYLQAEFKDAFDYNQFNEAEFYVSDALDEAEREFTIKQRLEYAKGQSWHYNSENHMLKRSVERSH